MSDTAIIVSDLHKKYDLGTINSGTFSEDLKKGWAKFRGKADPTLTIGADDSLKEYWALKGIDFEIKKGESVGIIGKNGAGKSTLLKILSRITAPTKGLIKIKGRIASLLEVGTGFHPDLTGRENIFMNGAILGMTRKEILRNLDEIIDFSGVEKHIDTPVKRYSSGMYVRLAFAVAAHLESEILIVDEVLAVGDAEFQKKCLGKMNDVSTKEGKTVLFVSHNMGAVSQLCSTAIFLSKGNLILKDTTDKAISQYFSTQAENVSFVNLDNKSSPNKKAFFKYISVKKSGEEKNKREFSIGDNIEINFGLYASHPNQPFIKTAVEIKNSEGRKLANMIDVDSDFQVQCSHPGLYEFSIVLKDVRLYPDKYYLNLYAGDLSSTEAYDYIEDVISFEILDGGNLTTRILPRQAGLLFLTPSWNETNRILNYGYSSNT